ncbi:unnamed protein product [Sphagnum troendelagicum]
MPYATLRFPRKLKCVSARMSAPIVKLPLITTAAVCYREDYVFLGWFNGVVFWDFVGYWFTGVQIRPEEPYTEPEPEGTKLRVTHATLGLESKGKQRTVVKCEVGERPEVLLCSLVPGVSESTSLDLLFDEEVVFTVSGDASVHLTGYYEPHEDQYNSGAADDYDSEEEDGYEFSDEDIDDEEEDEFGNFEDTDDVFPVRSSGGYKHPYNVVHRGLRIEEVNEEQPVAAANGAKKHLKAITDGSESKKRKKDDMSKNGANESAVKSTVKDADENGSEDEDGFALPGRNKKAVHSLEQSPRDVETPAEGKKNKKKKQKAAKAQASNEKITKTSELKADGDIQEPAAASKVADKTPAKKMTEKRVDMKQGTVEKPRKETSGEVVQPTASAKVAAKAQPKTPIEKRVDAEQATVEKPSKKEGSTMKKYPNGLEIENIAMGKPDGKQAKPGKRVSMHYIGKLKSNGKIFDSNVGKKPFDFRLGVGEVIKGWDVGVNGMRVGDKRRLTIPPQMAYGPEGVKGTIPGNAWLTFDVELVAVK